MSGRGSAARDIDGPWLSPPATMRLPALRRSFDLNRDPYVALQLADLEKSEQQRREESAGRASNDKPAPALKPPRHQRGDADRQGWLTAQRAAAFARAAVKDAAEAERTRESGKKPDEISRGLSL
ncbi:MAG: hypothetical protein GC191_13065 [Azospirillum sp.]|nr:hypothetical protein [Azospirillum sp.]